MRQHFDYITVAKKFKQICISYRILFFPFKLILTTLNRTTNASTNTSYPNINYA